MKGTTRGRERGCASDESRNADLGPNNPFLRNMAVFPADGAGRFAIDRLEVTLSPARSFPRSFVRGLRLTPEGYAMLHSPAAVRLPSGLAVQLSDADPHQTQFVGREAGVAMSYKTNVMRRVRRHLIAAGSYPARDPRSYGARSDNYIDPGRLSHEVDLHAESIKALWSALGEARELYRASIMKFFAFDLKPEAMQVTISRIELCWDVNTPVARATKIWERAWRCAFAGAGIGLGSEEEPLQVRQTSATEHRERDAVNGATVLRADSKKKRSRKLYPKDHRVLRFEAEEGGDGARKALGHRIRTDRIEQLEEDLLRLAAKPYATLVAAQRNLLCQRVLDAAEFVGVFMQAGRSWDKMRPIVEAWEAGDLFHNAAERHSDVLHRLRKMGHAQHVERGLWAPSGALQFTFARMLFARKRSEGPA